MGLVATPEGPGPDFAEPGVCTSDCGVQCFAGSGQACTAGASGCATFSLETGEKIYGITCPAPMS